VVTDCPAQHGKAPFNRNEQRSQRGRSLNLNLHFAIDARQIPQMKGKHDSYHGNIRPMFRVVLLLVPRTDLFALIV
jgi:hypothetical protein